MIRMLRFAALSSLVLCPLPAHAATVVTGVDALKEWNLIVLGDLVSSSEVEGRTFVGGNLSGNSSNYQIRTPAASSNGWSGLTVVGNVTGGTKNLNNGAGAVVGGNVTSGFNLNGPAQTVKVGGTIQNTNQNNNVILTNQAATPGFTAGLTDQKNALTSSMYDLSAAYAGLASNALVSIAGNRATFNAAPGANGVTVYSLTAADLGTFGEVNFNLNGASTVIVNVSGTAITLNDNFLGNSQYLGEKVIWNFADATALNLSTAWKGSVLAPKAAGTIGNYIEGSAVFGSLIQSGVIHLNTYNGGFTPPAAAGVPEPATWAMMIFGFGAIGSAIRYRGARRRGLG